MIINKRTTILVLVAICATSTNFVLAQRLDKLKKGANISLNIKSNKDSLESSLFNIGLLSNIYNLKGVGINVISSVVKNNMNGLQVSGLVSIAGNRANGFQFGGLANVAGNSANGLMVSGLINVAGNETKGVQFSLLGNIAGNVANGLAVGGLMNVAGNEMRGIQIGGLANISGKTQKGVAIAGLMNVVAEEMKGGQLSAIMNISGVNAKGAQISAVSNVGVNLNGMQFSALSNIAAGQMKGFQMCGAVNIAVETNRAFQLSGITNIAQSKMNGVQFAPGNYAGEMKGVQIGILNLAEGSAKGLQIGIINHSKDSTLHKIGLVNITPKTRIQLMAFTGNTSKINLAVRFKNRRTYSILGIGTHYLGLDDKFSGAMFYRTGLHYQLARKLEISGDLGYYHIESFENEDSNTPKRMYSLQGRVNLEYQIRRKFSIFASGGYGIMRYYDQNKFFDKKPIIALGVILF